VIARWALPGPSRTLADITARIAAGEHIVLRGPADFDLRLALEPLIAHNQRYLRPVVDDPSFSPAAVLWREHTAWHAPGTPDPTLAEIATALGRDTWWIENIDPDRAPPWSSFLTAFADLVRNLAPHDRPTLIVCFPDGVTGPSGLTITDQMPPGLTRADLDVAARYATANSSDNLACAVRVALAVEMSARDLPGLSALEALHNWLDAPDTVLTDPAALANHAAGTIDWAEASLLLWRAQAGPVTQAIDQARCEILRVHSSHWKIPFTRPPGHAFPARIEAHCQLELSDLIEQMATPPPALSAILIRLKDLRHARNKLSHLSPVTNATFHLLSQPLPDPTN
jgi:hypothetical protein